MKLSNMHKNQFFREITCGLDKKQTAKLCFKSVRQVTYWDSGKEIPPECKRLMKLDRKMILSTQEQWEGFKMENDKLELPSGQLVTPQQILTGIALLEIGAEPDLIITHKLMKYVRALVKIKRTR